MKKSLLSLALVSGTLLAVQAAEVQIDFGRSDATTAGVLNIGYPDSSSTTPSSTQSFALGTMPGEVTLAWTLAKVTDNLGNPGYTTTQTVEEEANWKNPFAGTMPFGLGNTFRDGLMTQLKDGAGTFTVTFTGLSAGKYDLSYFGGFKGKDRFASPRLTIGGADAANAVWTSYGTGSDGSWTQLTSATGANSGVLTPENASTVSADANKGVYSTVEDIVVGENGNLTLTIQGNGGVDSFSLTALNYLSLTQVPEPATAALSLLGLAGLALRRRRA